MGTAPNLMRNEQTGAVLGAALTAAWPDFLIKGAALERLGQANDMCVVSVASTGYHPYTLVMRVHHITQCSSSTALLEWILKLCAQMG